MFFLSEFLPRKGEGDRDEVVVEGDNSKKPRASAPIQYDICKDRYKHAAARRRPAARFASGCAGDPIGKQIDGGRCWD